MGKIWSKMASINSPDQEASKLVSHPEYVPLGKEGRLKIRFLISYAEVKRIEYFYRYMIIE